MVLYDIVLGTDIKLYVAKSKTIDAYKVQCVPVGDSNLAHYLGIQDNRWYDLNFLSILLFNTYQYVNTVLYDKKGRRIVWSTDGESIVINGKLLPINQRNIEYVVINCCKTRFKEINQIALTMSINTIPSSNILRQVFGIYHNIRRVIGRMDRIKPMAKTNVKLQEILLDSNLNPIEIIYMGYLYTYNDRAIDYDRVKGIHLNNRNFPQPPKITRFIIEEPQIEPNIIIVRKKKKNEPTVVNIPITDNLPNTTDIPITVNTPIAKTPTAKTSMVCNGDVCYMPDDESVEIFSVED